MNLRVTSLPLVLLIAALSLAGCSTASSSESASASPATVADSFSAEPTLVSTVSIPSGVQSDEVKKVVIESLVKRGWAILEQSNNSVKAHLNHRRYDSTLTISWNGSAIEILSDSYRVNKSGEKLGRQQPTGWIENLEKDFSVRLQSAVYLD